jgi:uncharacterized protein (DUF58 family)
VSAELSPDLVRRITRLELRTRLLVDSALIGAYRAAFRGRGAHFDGVRPYEPGDDVRAMDWKVSARTGDPHIKQFVEERELAVLLIVDDSGSMRLGSPVTKRDRAAEFAAAAALIAMRGGDRVGALVAHDGGIGYVPPRRGRNHVLRVIRAVLTQDADMSGADLAGALLLAVRGMRQRGIVFVLSDFLDPPEMYSRALALVARRHDTVAVLSHDVLERRWPDAGLVNVRDAETGAQMIIDAGSSRWRATFEARAHAFHGERVRAITRAGVELLALPDSESPLSALARFMRARAGRR